MSTHVDPVRTYTIDDPKAWFQRLNQYIYLGDVVDHTHNSTISIGFGRYGSGEENPWNMTYDEALIITKGTFTVRDTYGSATAHAGDVIFLPKGADVVYQADTDVELVYVSYPHWFDAASNSPHVHRLEEFQPSAPPARN